MGTYKVNKSARKLLINKDKSRAKTKKGITGGKMKKITGCTYGLLKRVIKHEDVRTGCTIHMTKHMIGCTYGVYGYVRRQKHHCGGIDGIVLQNWR